MAGVRTVAGVREVLDRIKDERPVTLLLNDCYKTIQQLEHRAIEAMELAERREAEIATLKYHLQFHKGETDE
jgi:hypothetical protein